MTTVVIQVGNSDDKLTQVEWADFVRSVRRVIGDKVLAHGGVIHLEGFPPADARWQNACWIVNLPPSYNDALMAAHALWQELAYMAVRYGQESAAWLEGKTRFVTPGSAYIRDDAEARTWVVP